MTSPKQLIGQLFSNGTVSNAGSALGRYLSPSALGQYAQRVGEAVVYPLRHAGQHKLSYAIGTGAIVTGLVLGACATAPTPTVTPSPTGTPKPAPTATATPPKPQVIELVRNGEFCNLDGWQEFFGGVDEIRAVQVPVYELGQLGLDVRTMKLTLDVVPDYTLPSVPCGFNPDNPLVIKDSRVSNPVLQIATEIEAANRARTYGVKQPVNRDVSGYPRAVLSFDVRPIHANVPLAGGGGIENAGVKVIGRKNGEYWERHLGVIYGEPERDAQIKFYMDRWGPDALKNKGNSITVPRNKWYHFEQDLSQLPDRPDFIEEIQVRGTGWDFNFKIDNVSIKLYEEPAPRSSLFNEGNPFTSRKAAWKSSKARAEAKTRSMKAKARI